MKIDHEQGRANLATVNRVPGSRGFASASATAGWAASLLLIAGLGAAANPVHPSAKDVRPLQPGASVPSVAVHAVDGNTVDLSTLVSESGALLVFYRGGW